MLAKLRRVSPATHRQASSAVLFLYREVLGQDLPWMNEIGRPPDRKRIASVLTAAKVAALLDCVDGEPEGLPVDARPASRPQRQELLGHSDVSTTMIYTHVLKVAAGTTRSPLDVLGPSAVRH